MSQTINTSVDIGGVRLANPVMTASGTFGYAMEFDEVLNLNRLGGVVMKGLSLYPSKGNPPPRIAETSCGMLNAIGLENVGIQRFIKEKLPVMRAFDTKVFINIYGKTVEEYAAIADTAEGVEGIHGIEINISCPNVSAGGLAFGVDPVAASNVVKAVKAKTTLPVMVKLSPNVTDITEIARSVEGEGADSVSLINTLTGMGIDIHTRKPLLANVVGGLSGPAVKPVAIRMVYQVAKAVKIPVIGMGGIMTADDAVEFLIAGASAVQVGTANFVYPDAAEKVVDGIEAFLKEKGISDVNDLIGSVEI
ncbi:dihydroorotate dehydrogenase [Desulfoluna spongiiphila]|uniref:Dihydroorotate dehydrogenase n=1 Tax=Desulfoluna spongiiphila TaxID=419481 RepID=A0A1G5JIX2_9BACT|nr:dihydroorotate dehydrogenase [Desulfoluna spongiiphila]SCY87830.1 dihydroorotate oxidase B, catalytic subunit [Desulfoluna spongiiphila]VVS94909.1 dihydroorotate dehydrogenase class 1/ 2 [Desulfoluna spongiiphila]